MWDTILEKQSDTILKMGETNIIKKSELKYTLKYKTFFQIDCTRILLLSSKYNADTWRIIFTSIHFQSHLISCLPPVLISCFPCLLPIDGREGSSQGVPRRQYGGPEPSVLLQEIMGGYSKRSEALNLKTGDETLILPECD